MTRQSKTQTLGGREGGAMELVCCCSAAALNLACFSLVSTLAAVRQRNQSDRLDETSPAGRPRTTVAGERGGGGRRDYFIVVSASQQLP